MGPSFLIHLNILVGAAGMTIYTLWACKWLHRKAWPLFTVNLLSAVATGGFVIGYLAISLRPELQPLVTHTGFRLLVPFVIGVPVVARIFEYRRDQDREHYTRLITKRLLGDSDGVA